MQAIAVVPIYAAALTAIYLALSLRVIGLRRSRRVAIGTNGDSAVERSMRVHANFAEYVPFALILLLLAEMQGNSPLVLHLLCTVLVIGRLAHAWGVSREREDFRFRVTGMALTFGVLISAALLLLWRSIGM